MSPAQKIQELFRQHIPLTCAMGVVVESYDGVELVLTAPHEPNHNHLDTAFGGSLHALATLSGYGWLWLELGLREDTSPVHVVVRESTMKYLRPVRGELRAVCRRPTEQVVARFWKEFNAKGKARLTLEANISEQGEVCALFQGEFVAVS